MECLKISRFEPACMHICSAGVGNVLYICVCVYIYMYAYLQRRGRERTYNANAWLVVRRTKPSVLFAA